MNLLPIEKETIITTSDEDKSKWHIYTRQKKIIDKLIKQGREAFNVKYNENGDIYSAEFEIEYDVLNFRNKKKIYTEEEKQAMRERMLYARSKK